MLVDSGILGVLLARKISFHTRNVSTQTIMLQSNYGIRHKMVILNGILCAKFSYSDIALYMPGGPVGRLSVE